MNTGAYLTSGTVAVQPQLLSFHENKSADTEQQQSISISDFRKPLVSFFVYLLDDALLAA
jgi:hypothetical protein